MDSQKATEFGPRLYPRTTLQHECYDECCSYEEVREVYPQNLAEAVRSVIIELTMPIYNYFVFKFDILKRLI